MTAVLPDAAPTNWVDRFAPPPLRPWLKLARLDRPTGIWLLMLPGWQGIALASAGLDKWPPLSLLALVFAGALLMRSAGCAYNDIVDRDLDARVARTAARPVASGQIGVKAAWGFVVACSLVSLVVLLSLNVIAIALGVLSLGLVAAYPFMKRITWWPQAWLGLTFNWGVLLGYAATTAAPTIWQLAHGVDSWVAHANIGVLLLYASAISWTLGYDTLYAVQDLEDDALAGVKSSARRLGGNTQLAVMIFYLVALALAAAAGLLAHLSLYFWPLLAVYGVSLLAQTVNLKLDDPAGALRRFQANTWSGFILFVALVAGGLSL